jgi:hypothetical protein
MKKLKLNFGMIGMVAGTIFILFAYGCSATNQTATQQIMQTTSDPIKIADAMYFDVMGIYKDTAQIYLRYKPIVQKSNPDIDIMVVQKLNEMKKNLDEWKVLSGTAKMIAINQGTDEFHEMRRQIIFDLADYLEKGN